MPFLLTTPIHTVIQERKKSKPKSVAKIATVTAVMIPNLMIAINLTATETVIMTATFTKGAVIENHQQLQHAKAPVVRVHRMNRKTKPVAIENFQSSNRTRQQAVVRLS